MFQQNLILKLHYDLRNNFRFGYRNPLMLDIGAFKYYCIIKQYLCLNFFVECL